MTMHFQLIVVVTCLGQIADSRSHGSSTKQNHGTLHDNYISDDASAEGSGAVDVFEVTSLKPIISTPTTETSSCTPEYAAIRGHTMCRLDSPEMTSFGVTNQEREDIVKLHNSLRSRVEPPATDLLKLAWDERLAAVAEKWARQCKTGHDAERSIPGYGIYTGQNFAAGYRDWETAIMAWYNEVKLYRYGEDAERYLGKGGWRKVGHYTQIVHKYASIIGCGFALCPRTKYRRFYVCNYGSGQGSLSFPYTRGERCSSCPNTCTAGLCDCGGKICFNGGALDKDTCKCSCHRLYKGPTCHRSPCGGKKCLNRSRLDYSTCTCKCKAPYEGSTCQTVKCPAKDSFYCGRTLVEKDCKRYSHVPNLCPYMCGICGSSVTTKNTSGASTESPGGSATFTSEHGCTYSGQRASKAECLTYGDHGTDMLVCESMGGTHATCDHCNQFFNVKTDFCPVMCGFCDAPCGGKKCLNGGRLDVSTCTCSCKAPYVGNTCQTALCGGKRCLNGGRLDVSTCTCTCKAPFEGNTCQTANCPARDPFQCFLYPSSHCTRFVNAPSICPHLCGIC